ncbi:hypothetical protein BGZ65_012707, partial [Modicella reniformis]
MPPKRKPNDDAAVERPPPKRASEDEEAEDSMVIKTLAKMVYGKKTNKIHMKAAEYIMSINEDDGELGTKAFVAYVRGVYPIVNLISMSNAWSKLHQFFTGDLSQKEQHERLIGLLGVPRMVEAFRRLPGVLDDKDGETGDSEGDSEGEAGRASHQSREISGAASSTSTSRRFSIKSVSSGRSGSSNGNLNSAALVNLRQTYEENWRVYTGQNWVLPSGITLDEVVHAALLCHQRCNWLRIDGTR